MVSFSLAICLLLLLLLEMSGSGWVCALIVNTGITYNYDFKGI